MTVTQAEWRALKEKRAIVRNLAAIIGRDNAETLADALDDLDDTSRCELDTCGVVIPYELSSENGGPGFCSTEHEREARE